MSYIGNEPIVSATRTITEVTATAGQTVFTANGGYTVGYIDVFLNGAQLQTVDFTATNGTTITLTEAAQVGDVIRLVAWGTFSTATHVLKAGDTMTGDLDVLANIGVGTLTPNKGGVGRAVTLNTASGGNIVEMCVAEDRKGWMYADDSRTALAAGGNRLAEIQTNGTARIVVDGSGRVTMPAQPMVWASSYGLSGTAGSANPLILTTSLLNIGGHFNTSNGRFTAPIAGRYQVIFTALKQSSGGADFSIRKNGSIILQAYGGGDATTVASHVIVELVANDYISFSTTGPYYTDYTSYSVQLIS